MKIVFLQSMHDVIGGIQSVNKKLAWLFTKNGDETHIISLRKSGYNDDVQYEPYCNNVLINDHDEWGTIRKKEILENVKKLHILKAILLYIKRIKIQINLKKDYRKLSKVIENINPDFIINSHYELLKGIPKNYLNKTIMHFHTSFNEVKKNNSYKKTFDKYKDKIFKFVWLSKATCEKAISEGYKNSVYIYNPLSYTSKEVANVKENKNLIFLGRLSREKRIDLLFDIFNKVSVNNPDWNLLIYSNNVFDEYNSYLKNKRIKFMGSTNNPKEVYLNAAINLNTSLFEGLPMTFLEANECGVPTITFDCSESIKEIINSNENGIIIPQNDILQYEKELNNLMNNPELLEKLSKNCKKDNSRFNDQNIFNAWIDLLKRD